MLPNFLVIGAPRSGTTWIDENLRDHPSVHMARMKETHFFDQNYHRGMAYYESCFAGWKGEPAVGEATPDYLHGQYSAYDIPRLIRRHLPEVRLIASLRNPVDRVYSEFWNTKAKDARNARLSFEAKLQSKPQFIREGFYYEHLRRFYDLFPAERILVLLYDDLVADPRAFMRRIYEFIGVDPGFRSSYETVRVNQARGKKLLARSQTLWHLSRALDRARLHGLAESVRRFNSVEIPAMDRSTRERLIELYRPHNEKLAGLIGRDLSHWNRIDGPETTATTRLPAEGSRATGAPASFSSPNGRSG